MAERPALRQDGQLRPDDPRWRLTTRIAFRFCATYFTLYITFTQMLTDLVMMPVRGVAIPELGTRLPMRPIVSWVASRLFHVNHELVFSSGSGDKTFDWVEAFCLLIIAIVATVIWSLIDRRRLADDILYKWFRLLVKFGLGSTMFVYGTYKAIPVQMPSPSLGRLLEPFGNFSPMGVLWTSIGASPAYEIFTGCAELLGGVLVMLPRTTMLGALICLADTTQVFVLNMTYDVPVKLFSFHLIVLSLILLAPDAGRLIAFFFHDEPVPAAASRTLFRSVSANRRAAVVQICLIAYLAVLHLLSARGSWTRYGPGAPKSLLYGIWNVSQLTIDGEVRPPTLTDYGRWRRVVFDRPTPVTFYRMDDTSVSYSAGISPEANTLTLTGGTESRWRAAFHFSRPSSDQLVLDGTMNEQHVQMKLELVNRSAIPLVSRGFHWIQEYPFNR